MGNVYISNIFITFVMFVFLMYSTSYFISILKVFVNYQSLENIISKYIFVLQNYGELTKEEELDLYKDLEKRGFNLEKVTINLPKNMKYGELSEFYIKYTINLNKYFINLKKEEEQFDICVRKFFYTIK